MIPLTFLHLPFSTTITAGSWEGCYNMNFPKKSSGSNKDRMIAKFMQVILSIVYLIMYLNKSPIWIELRIIQ